jgi:hypothetical protein
MVNIYVFIYLLIYRLATSGLLELGGSILGGGWNFAPLHRVQTSSRAHPASCIACTGRFFPYW